MKYLLLCFCSAALFFACSSLTSFPESQLKSDYYHYRTGKAKFEKVYVKVMDDSLTILQLDGTILPNTNNQKFHRRGLDIDVLTVPFKFRPTASDFPRQLTTSFNGSVYVGYRIDRYKNYSVKTPLESSNHFRQRGITIGAFGGIGSASVTPWTTNYRTTDEYTAFIFNRGLALMIGVNQLTVGVGIGWDYLTDRDKDIWIYQNKHWYGLTLSLHLN